jgi:membrane protein DedA with SNARE-associated domain
MTGGNTLSPSGFGPETTQGELVKGLGYIVSTLSVLLLGAAASKGASKEPLLLACLIAGMATSIVGMWLRYYSYRRDDA